jgi:predicted O-methyltransferase YrrM
MDARARLDQISAGYQDAIILLAANHLGVFAQLAHGSRTAAELAGELGLDARALELVMLALAAAGVVERRDDGGFRLPSEMAAFLDPAGAQTMVSILGHHHHLLDRWAHLADVVRTGRPAATQERRDEELRAFICGMKDISRRSTVEVVEALPELGQCRCLLDLGGGPGTAAITFCREWPHMTAVVFDLPEVTVLAEAEIAEAGLAGRVMTKAGDFHTDAFLRLGEAPYEAVYISNIIHSLDPDETRALLAKAVDALAPGGLLVVKDFFLDDSRTMPAHAARFAVNMLVGTPGGKSYTWTETEAMLRELGVGDFKSLPVASVSGLLVGRRSG